ncbi:MAG: LysM peptidoglycan-binding domain-containing protein [Bacteroidia bacterium]|nr:LysM peptidoglycan-binding domain-containing protein [Bacteroidia bacterium]
MGMKINLKISITVFVLSISYLFSQGTPTLCPDSKPCLLYEVQKKESLYGISKKFNTTQEIILNYNPDIRTNGLKAGQKIFIPDPSFSTTPSTPTTITPNNHTINIQVPETYTVKKGETFYSIQKQFKLTRQEILDMNPGLNPENLPEGTVLRLKKLPDETARELAEKFRNKNFQGNVAEGITLIAAPSVTFENKKSYVLVLLLPFLHPEAENQTPAEWEKNIPFPDEASTVVDFAWGLEYGLRASLPEDYQIQIKYVHEAAPDSIFEPYWKKFMNNHSPDIIIGPYFPEHINIVTQISKTKNIPLISPWISHNKFLHEYPLALKFITSQQTMAENLAKFIADSLIPLKYKPVCFQASLKDLKEQTYIRLFKQAFLAKNIANGKRDSLPVLRNMSELKKFIDANEKTAIITLSQNKVLMTDFITQLHLASQKKNVMLLGLRSLLEFENIDQEYLNYFQFTFPAFTEFDARPDSLFADKYRSIFNVAPGDYARLGKSLGNFLAKMLKDYGLNFLNQTQIKYSDDFVKLLFIRPDFQTGLDNVGSFIYQIYQYQFRKTGWN